MSRSAFFFLSFLFLSLVYFSDFTNVEARPNNFKLAYKAVVHIRTTAFRYTYVKPWQPPRISRSSGTGFVIEQGGKKKILTNAHVVSGANTIHLQRPDQVRDYLAKLDFIAHDCDLALLSVPEETFFEGVVPLEIGNLPLLNSPVEVIGFPIGGKTISITRGIISRIDTDLYSHSGVDHHLTIQVDAAINPGNSGGPALQDAKVIGVAFQALSQGENLGYLIPPIVINHFLEDIKDGYYDGYIEFGLLTEKTRNPNVKQVYNLDALLGEYTGVLAYGTIPGASTEKQIKKDDILFEINSKKITSSGQVKIDGRLQDYTQVVDNLFKGDNITVGLLREGKKLEISFPAKRTDAFAFRRRNYEEAPSYEVLAGLLFQPLDANLLRQYQRTWFRLGHSEILYRYHHYFLAEIYKEVSQDVILTQRLADPINSYAKDFVHRIVKSVNGKKIRSFMHFHLLLRKALKKEKYIRIAFYELSKVLVLQTKYLKKKEANILKKYGIASPYSIGLRFRSKKDLKKESLL